MSITSANSILQLGVSIVFPTPQQIQGFTTDDIYGVGNIKPNDTAEVSAENGKMTFKAAEPTKQEPAEAS